MLSLAQLEESYKYFMTNLSKCAHDGVIPIDLPFLHKIGLLNSPSSDPANPNDLIQYFQVVETPEKVTLFNEQFAIWITPRVEKETPFTYVLIATAHTDGPHLEIVFMTSGVYNTPRYVLKVLQHFLVDMLETEAALLAMEKEQG